MSDSEKLSIRIAYDEAKGLPLKELNNYLAGVNAQYDNFTNKNLN